MSTARKITIIGSAFAVLMVAGIAYAAWTATGTGSGSAKAVSAQPLTTVDASASTTAQLYPGGSGDLILTVHNPNPYAVDVLQVNGNGPITSTAAGCTTTGVTFNNYGAPPALHVNANADASFTLTGHVQMDNTSMDACQGSIFTVPVSLIGDSA